MRAAIGIILKTFLGGVLGVFAFLSPGSIKGIFDMLYETGNLPPIHFVPVVILLGIIFGAWYAQWLGGDFILLAAFIGLEIAFLISSQKVIFRLFSKQKGRIILGTAFLVMVITTSLFFYVKDQRINQIENIYSNFHASVQARDYPSAYMYFSPEYRMQTNLDQFIEDKMWPESIYESDAKFVSSFGNTAHVYPDEYTVAKFVGFPGGPEIIMKNINGEWYLTGELNWYMD